MNGLQRFIVKNMLGMEVKAAPKGSITPYFLDGANYRFINGTLTMITDNTANYINKGYTVNDIVYSIVKLITEKVKVAPWGLYKVVDESSLKMAQAISRKGDLTPEDTRLVRNYKRKALEPFNGSNKITDLLKYPNEWDTFQDFVAMSAGYMLLTGNSYTYGDIIPGGANQGKPNALYAMPSQFMQIIAIAGFPGDVVGYRIQLQGGNAYDTSQVMHIKEPNYRWSFNGEQWYGMSPLKAGLMRLNRSNSALESSTARFQNNGADGVLFVKEPNIPATQRGAATAQANAVKASWINEYTGNANAGKIATSGYEMGFIPIGISPADLKILESEKADLRFLCSLYGVPSQLMNDPENKSFNNVKESERALTTRCALPKLISIRDNLNRKFSKDWGMAPGLMIDFDMSVFTELSETVGDTMRWLQPLLVQGFPLNRALDLLSLETVEDPLFDEPWITSSMGVPLSEWKMNPVDAGLNTGGSLDESM